MCGGGEGGFFLFLNLFVGNGGVGDRGTVCSGLRVCGG